jgi:FtsZ-binding cell division protein ZapB
MEEKDRLQDIPQFRTLEENLELRVALQQVDKLKTENVSLDYINSEQQVIIKNLKAENLALKTELDEWKDEIMQMPGVVERPDEDVEDRVMPESIQEEINMNELNEQSVQAEIEKAREEDEFYSDLLGPPTYEDLVDPEFDRGFKMGQDWLIDDIIKYLKSIRNKGKA